MKVRSGAVINYIYMQDLPSSFLEDLDLQASDLLDIFPKLNLSFKNTTTSRKTSRNTWTEEEKLKYFKIIKNNTDLFNLSVKERKCAGIHVLMSREINTRTSLQCRSHHQKMLKKYGNIQRILASSSNILEKEKSCNEEKLVQLQKCQISNLINYDQIEAEMRQQTIWEKMIDIDTAHIFNLECINI